MYNIIGGLQGGCDLCYHTRMKMLLANVEAVKMLAADWHYNAIGNPFYGLHLLADKIADDFNGLEDELKEVYYLGEKKSVPPTAGVITEAALAEYNSVEGASLQAKLSIALGILAAHAEELSRKDDFSIGTESILDSLSAKAYRAIGLIERTLAT